METARGQRIGEVRVIGLKHTKPAVVLRELSQLEGVEFDSLALLSDLDQLHNLELFSQIDYLVEPDSLHQTLRITWALEERWTFFPYPMIEYAEETGWIFGVGMLNLNFRGWNEKLVGEYTWGSAQNFNLEYIKPWFGNERSVLGVNLLKSRFRNQLEDFEQTNSLVEVRWEKYFGRNDFLIVKPLWMQVEADQDEITINPDRIDHFGGLVLSGGLNRYDITLNPARGYRLTLTEQLSHGGPDQPSFVSTVLVGGTVYSLTRRIRLATGGRLYYQSGRLPHYYYRHTGGKSAVRSYAAEYGPGRHSVTGSVELRTLIFEKWRMVPHFDLSLIMALFYDTGRTWNEPGLLDLSSLDGGPGISSIVLMPFMGMARMDVGYNPAQKEITLHFSNSIRF